MQYDSNLTHLCLVTFFFVRKIHSVTNVSITMRMLFRCLQTVQGFSARLVHCKKKKVGQFHIPGHVWYSYHQVAENCNFRDIALVYEWSIFCMLQCQLLRIVMVNMVSHNIPLWVQDTVALIVLLLLRAFVQILVYLEMYLIWILCFHLFVYCFVFMCTSENI